jgi:CHAT domain
MALRTLQLDMVVAHDTSWALDRVESFRTAVSAVIGRVESHIRNRYPWVRLRSRCLTVDQACALGDVSTTCAVAILDATDCSAELALLAGRLQGGRIPYVVSCQVGSKGEATRLGINSSELVLYSSVDQLANANSVMERELLRAVPEARIHEELIYQFWFPRETSTIWVVCPQIHDPGAYADRSSPDYTYLDNLGDTDALLDVMVFLSQYYPKATIEHFSSCHLPEGHTSSNLVVIGGPGSDEISNDLCGEMLRTMEACVGYSDDCERMIVTPHGGEAAIQYEAEYGVRHQSEQQGQFGLRKDRGCFARFPNPLNEKAGVVLINGIHTAGVLGAARIFSERREALRNFDAVLASTANPDSFECHFEVIVLNGEVKVPRVDPANIHTLGTPEPTAVAATRAHATAASGDSGASVKVLLIAGDRGGTQVNQLQIPREYGAIQEALRSCKHRDVIALANPILGATREKLAVAYREIPTIVHFSGHGNDRSLSIVEDRDVIAREIPLDGKQLCEMFKTMHPRVRLCVLNSCGSKVLAQQLVEAGAVECAIGWPERVSDSAAIAFSRALYGALGDGLCIDEALSVAKIASGTGEEPVLFTAGEPRTIVFVDGESKNHD